MVKSVPDSKKLFWTPHLFRLGQPCPLWRWGAFHRLFGFLLHGWHADEGRRFLSSARRRGVARGGNPCLWGHHVPEIRDLAMWCGRLLWSCDPSALMVNIQGERLLVHLIFPLLEHLAPSSLVHLEHASESLTEYTPISDDIEDALLNLPWFTTYSLVFRRLYMYIFFRTISKETHLTWDAYPAWPTKHHGWNLWFELVDAHRSVSRVLSFCYTYTSMAENVTHRYSTYFDHVPSGLVIVPAALGREPVCQTCFLFGLSLLKVMCDFPTSELNRPIIRRIPFVPSDDPKAYCIELVTPRVNLYKTEPRVCWGITGTIDYHWSSSSHS